MYAYKGGGSDWARGVGWGWEIGGGGGVRVEGLETGFFVSL